MRWSSLLRVAATAAVLIAAVVVWTVYRTVRQAQDCNEWVVHTQEVLAQLETVLQSLRSDRVRPAVGIPARTSNRWENAASPSTTSVVLNGSSYANGWIQ